MFKMNNTKFIVINGKRKKTRLYNIWSQMKCRCTNPNGKDFERYAARGISVCSDWQVFELFHTWAKANGYRGNLTLDRVDNDDGYRPGNCRWADKYTQVDNREISIFFTYQGEERSLRHWAKMVGIKYNTIYKRIFIYGWSFEYAITAPLCAPAPPDAKPKPKPAPVTPDKYGF